MAKCQACGAPVNLAPDGDPRYEPPRIAARPSKAMTAERLADSLFYAKLRAELERTDLYGGEHDLAATLEDLLAHIDAQAAEIGALKAELATAREDLIIKAASIADDWLSARSGFGPQYDAGIRFAAAQIGDAVRALKDQTP